MGMESESALMNGALYLNDEPVLRGKLQEITVQVDAPESEIVLDFQLPPLTFYIKMPKRMRCRSRKRFIKLMMSEGISRNGAVWLADFVRERIPYEEAWRKYILHNIGIIMVG